MKRTYIIGIGNIYVETNYLGLITGGKSVLEAGKEYKAKEWEVRLGGSVVNIVTQAKRLGADVGLIGKMGKDEAANKLLDLLKQEGISSELIATSADVQTSVDTGVVFEHSGENIQFVSGNANQKLSKADIDLTHPHFKEVEAIYLGGFLKQESLYEDYPEILQKMSEMEIRLFLDHGRIPVDMTESQRNALYQAMKYIEGYFPNEQELLGITQKNTVDEALDTALSMGPKLVVVKLGEKGCRIKTKTEDISISGHSVKVISTVGAGDAFNAGFITQYLQGKDLKTCGEFGTATATVRVSKNYQPDYEEVKKLLQ